MYHEYCPGCGGQVFLQRGDDLLCRVCGKRVHYADLGRERLRIGQARLIIAARFLSRLPGGFTQLDMASHLHVSKSPHLTARLDWLVSRKIVTRTLRSHERTNRPTWFYTTANGAKPDGFENEHLHKAK